MSCAVWPYLFGTRQPALWSASYGSRMCFELFDGVVVAPEREVVQDGVPVKVREVEVGAIEASESC